MIYQAIILSEITIIMGYDELTNCDQIMSLHLFNIVIQKDYPHLITSLRTVRRKAKLMFILCFSSNRNAFYLYRVTGAVCSSTPCYAHAWLYKGCGYCTELSVPCTSSSSVVVGSNRDPDSSAENEYEPHRNISYKHHKCKYRI